MESYQIQTHKYCQTPDIHLNCSFNLDSERCPRMNKIQKAFLLTLLHPMNNSESKIKPSTYNCTVRLNYEEMLRKMIN
jgi:hypothetical protein